MELWDALCKRRDVIIALSIFCALFFILYGTIPYAMGYGGTSVSLIYGLWWMWMHTPEWGHCMLAPIISVVIIYLERDKLLQSEIKPVKWAVWPVVVALLLYYLGFRIDIVQFSFVCMHFTLGAFIIWFFGWNVFRALLFPYVFLIFAWPLPFLDSLAFHLRVFMSEISYVFLNLIGIDAIRSGTAIVSAPETGLPQGARFALDVADPCSGIRSLFALTMLTALMAYFTQKNLIRGGILFLCAIPLAIFGNFVRVLILAFGTLLFGADFAIGSEINPSFYHMLSGYFVFIVAIAGTLVISWLLNDGWKLCIKLFQFTPPTRNSDHASF